MQCDALRLQVEELEIELKKTRKRSYALERMLLSSANGFYDTREQYEELNVNNGVNDLRDLTTANHTREHLSPDHTRTNHMTDDSSCDHMGMDDSSYYIPGRTNQTTDNYRNNTRRTNHTRDNNLRDPTNESRETIERTTSTTHYQICNENHMNSLDQKNKPWTLDGNNNSVSCRTYLGEYETDLPREHSIKEASFKSPHRVHVFYPEARNMNLKMNPSRRRCSV